jgi:hypothetical protein
MTVQEIVTQATTILLANSGLTLVASLAASALVIIYDVKTGYSFKLPGTGRLGLGAGLAVFGSTVWFWSNGGLQALLSEVAGGIFGGIFIAAIIGFFMQRK